jgi:hypothetical protein
VTHGGWSYVTATPASPLAVFRGGPLPAYWRFHQAVAKAQLAAWLPGRPGLLVDISGPAAASAAQAGAVCHHVLQVVPAAGLPRQRAGGPPGGAGNRPGRAGTVEQVLADPGSLEFLADECADGVVADDAALSRHLMTEDLAAEITRVLRPGAELFVSVDSLVLGMAMLAEQRHWAQLMDLPQAEVVLIPRPDGSVTRCFGAAQLTELLTDAGLHVRWVRPRTVLSPSMIDLVLRRDRGAMPRLVASELLAERKTSASVPAEDSFGIRLIACARKCPRP